MSRRGPIALLALLALAGLACEGGAGAGEASGSAPGPSRTGQASRAASGLPSSMVALGDSLTAGYGACVVLAPCLRNSWATGDGGPVQSHYQRIVAQNPAMRGNARNVAVPGATSAGLPAQARAAARAPADYVTVLIGANDACRGRLADMTDERTFRANIDTALGVLKQGLPKARILLVSVPDLHRLWEVGHTNAAVTRVWSVGVCPALLADPTSTAPPDVRRRNAVAARIAGYNSQLEGACVAYGSRCRTDGGAVHGVAFSLSLVAVADFFHPNVDGQARIARASYPRRFNW